MNPNDALAAVASFDKAADECDFVDELPATIVSLYNIAALLSIAYVRTHGPAMLADARDGERRFPMQRGPSIPWSLAEAIYAGYAADYGTSQSLARLAERGGFSWPEVEIIYKSKRAKAAIDTAIGQDKGEQQ